MDTLFDLIAVLLSAYFVALWDMVGLIIRVSPLDGGRRSRDQAAVTTRSRGDKTGSFAVAPLSPVSPFGFTAGPSPVPSLCSEEVASSRKEGVQDGRERLGEGSFGRVYREGGEAVKESECAGAEAEEGVKWEFGCMQRCACDNVVRASSLTFHNRTARMRMELCAGGSIQDWLEAHSQDKSISDREAFAVGFLWQALLGLVQIHSRGLVHADIKPHNILLSRSIRGWRDEAEQGLFKIADFGIAFEDGERFLSPAGTPGYWAPEMEHVGTGGPGPSFSADLFSLGVTFWAIISNRCMTQSTSTWMLP